jgi:hypothetical protein
MDTASEGYKMLVMGVVSSVAYEVLLLMRFAAIEIERYIIHTYISPEP